MKIAIILTLAVAATLADAAAFVLIIGQGKAAEANELVRHMPQWMALAGKALVVVVLALYAVALADRHNRALLAVLVVATLVGSIGAITTIASGGSR